MRNVFVNFLFDADVECVLCDVIVGCVVRCGCGLCLCLCDVLCDAYVGSLCV